MITTNTQDFADTYHFSYADARGFLRVMRGLELAREVEVDDDEKRPGRRSTNYQLNNSFRIDWDAAKDSAVERKERERKEQYDRLMKEVEEAKKRHLKAVEDIPNAQRLAQENADKLRAQADELHAKLEAFENGEDVDTSEEE